MASDHLLRIENDGPAIRATDYWRSPFAAAAYLSFNAGAARLLLPDSLAHIVPKLRAAREVIVSRGPWPQRQRRDAIEVLFEDGSGQPYAFHLGTEQVHPLPAPPEHGAAIRCTVWIRGDRDAPVEALAFPARIRFSPRLPDLRPWSAARSE